MYDEETNAMRYSKFSIPYILRNKMVRNGLSSLIWPNVIDTSSTVIPYESPQIDTNSSIFNSEKFRGGFEYFLYKALIIYLEIIAL